jgi:ankyrin repeat protein
VSKWPTAVNETNKNGDLPLHLACWKNAPLDVIKWLVAKWPDAVKEKDNDGDLPLHAACLENVALDMDQWLAKTCPDAVKEKNNNGSTPLACAKERCADIHTVSWLEGVKLQQNNSK